MIEWLTAASLSDYGSWASIIGIALSGATLLLVAKLKKKMLFNTSIDEHRTALESLSLEISRLLGEFTKNLSDVDEKFAIANVKLRDLQKGASNDLLKDIKITRKRIKYFRVRYRLNISFFLPGEQLARLIYTDINIVVEELGNVKKSIMVGG